MQLADAFVLIGLLGTGGLAGDLDLSAVQDILGKTLTETVNYVLGTGGSHRRVPIQSYFSIELIDVLPTGSGAPRVRKFEFGKWYRNSFHVSYHCTMKSQDWFVYIIRNEKGHLYTGITTDVERRFREHSSSKKGAKFFGSGAPVEVVYRKKFRNRGEALSYEAMIKSLTRKKKLELLEMAA